MPFSGYKNFQACVTAQKKKGKSDESARKICGYLQKKAEGLNRELTEEEYNQVATAMWIEDVLNHGST